MRTIEITTTVTVCEFNELTQQQQKNIAQGIYNDLKKQGLLSDIIDEELQEFTNITLSNAGVDIEISTLSPWEIAYNDFSDDAVFVADNVVEMLPMAVRAVYSHANNRPTLYDLDFFYLGDYVTEEEKYSAYEKISKVTEKIRVAFKIVEEKYMQLENDEHAPYLQTLAKHHWYTLGGKNIREKTAEELKESEVQ